MASKTPTSLIVNDSPDGSGGQNASITLKLAHQPLTMIYANAIRRTLLDEIPYVAFAPNSIEHTHFKNNTSIFTDEFLRLRLAMIPLSLSKGVVVRQARNKFVFEGNAPVLSVTKSNTNSDAKSEIVKVTSNDLQVTSKNNKHFVVPSGYGVGYDPVSRSYPIVAKLRPSESLSVTCIVECGRGLEHAAFSPVGAIGYRVQENSVTLEVESNNAGEPGAIQHTYDTLWWASTYIKDFQSDITDAPIHVNDTSNGLVVSFKHISETTATLILAEARQILDNKGMASYRVPHPLTPVIEFHLSPPQDSGISDLKTWGRHLLRSASRKVVQQLEKLQRDIAQHDHDRDWSPTVKDNYNTSS